MTRAAYETMHGNEKRFQGYSISPHVDAIAELVRRTGARRLLDYGSGKGYQYLVARVHERWGGILPYCYDIGLPALAGTRDLGPFDGVICTDVMEHVPTDRVDEVLQDIFKLATKFVYLSISCAPARKTLPDGRNAHLTVMPPQWWDDRIALASTTSEAFFEVSYEDL